MKEIAFQMSDDLGNSTQFIWSWCKQFFGNGVDGFLYDLEKNGVLISQSICSLYK